MGRMRWSLEEEEEQELARKTEDQQETGRGGVDNGFPINLCLREPRSIKVRIHALLLLTLLVLPAQEAN